MNKFSQLGEIKVAYRALKFDCDDASVNERMRQTAIHHQRSGNLRRLTILCAFALAACEQKPSGSALDQLNNDLAVKEAAKPAAERSVDAAAARLTLQRIQQQVSDDESAAARQKAVEQVEVVQSVAPVQVDVYVHR